MRNKHLAGAVFFLLVGIGTLSAQAAADSAELVMVNKLEDQTGYGFYLAFIVALDKLPDPLLVMPRGRFVRVKLPPGTYHLKGIGYWNMQSKEFLNFIPGASGTELVLKAGETTILPWILQSRLVLVDKKGSFRPEVYPVGATPADLKALRTEYEGARKKGSSEVLPAVAAASLFQSINNRPGPAGSGGLRFAQDDKPFATYAAEQHIGFPGEFTADDGEALLPRLEVDAARRTVTANGYLPRTGILSIDWGSQAYTSGVNGKYEAASLSHTFDGSASIVHIHFNWQPRSGAPITSDFFVHFDQPAPPVTDRVERKLDDGTRVIIEDSLVQVISPTAADDYAKGRFGKQTMSAAMMSIFNDSFDFLYVAPGTHFELVASGEAEKLLNDTQGVGLSIFGNPVSRKLRSLIRLTARESFTGGWSLMCHELMHSWGNYVIQTEDGGGHWGNSTAAGKLGGIEADTLTELSPGTYRAHALDTFHDWWLPYGELELYLMGLAPASEVPPTRVFSGVKIIEEQRKYVPGDYVIFSAEKTETVTIKDIISRYGPRVPAYGNAPNKFRALCVLLTDHELSPLETAPVRESIRVFADPRPLTFGSGNSAWLNFSASTRGRATIQVDGLLDEMRAEAPAAAVNPGDTAELVFVNALDNQTSMDFWQAFLIDLDAFSDPLLIGPVGRFVRVKLPPGTYHLKHIGGWLLDQRKFWIWYPGIAETDLELKPGEARIFPWVLQSRIVNLGKGSYRPEVLPVPITAGQLAGLRGEYDTAVRAGSGDAPAPRSASTMQQPTGQ